MINRPLIFIGSRSHMNDLAITADHMKRPILGILDYQYYGNQDFICDIPVIGNDRWLTDSSNVQAQAWIRNCDFFVATLNSGNQVDAESGLNRERIRLQRIKMLEDLGLRTINLIDPESRLSRDLVSKYSDIKLGRGIYVGPFVDIMHGTTIGDFCIIEHQSFIGHHVTIGRNTNILGDCQLNWCDIGKNVVIGFGSKTIHNSRHPRYLIGDWSTIWAHSSITQDIPLNSIYTTQGRILQKYRDMSWASQIDQ